MARLHPGVYIEEVSSGVRPIEGVSTSTAAFLGKVEMGDIGKAVLVTSLQEFQKKYGAFLSDSFLAHGVYQFFNNGGKTCYIVRIAGTGARAADIALKDRKGSPALPAKTLTVRAASEGVWGNTVDIVVTDGTLDPDNEFAVQVYRDRSTQVPPLPALLLETFDNLSMNPAAGNYVETVINANSTYIRADVEDANLTTAGPGVSRSGALPVSDGSGSADLKLSPGQATRVQGTATTNGTLTSGANPSVPSADKRKLQISINGDGPHEVIIPPEMDTHVKIAEALQKIVREDITPNSSMSQDAFAGFTCVYDAGTSMYLLTSGAPGTNSSVIVGDGAVLLKLDAGQATATPGTATEKGSLRSGYNPLPYPSGVAYKFQINLDNDGYHDVVALPTASTGTQIAAAIQAAVRQITATTATNQTAFNQFTCSYDTTNPAQTFYLLKSGTVGTSSTVSVQSSSPEDETIKLEAGTYKFVIEINGDGPHLVSFNGPCANGAAIASAITGAVTGITPKRSTNADAFAPGKFQCEYVNTPAIGNPVLKLTSGKAGVASSVRITDAPTDNVAGLLKLGLTNGGQEITGAATLRPANSKTPTEYHLGDATVSGNIDSITPGDDGGTPSDQDYISGLNALDTVRDVSILCIPGIGSKAVVDGGTNYCTQRADCFFIGDCNKTDDTVEEAQAFLTSLTVKSSYGAIYYPWLKMLDPTGASPVPIAVPPSGFVAGMYARIDAKRGVWKAPAGTEANIGGAVGVTADTTDVQQDSLNPIGVNVIRTFPASGIVIWGARTLATRSDPEYRYIPVRRTAIFLEQSIYNGIQWAVFEPNDEDLWASLRLNITSFMMTLYRQGAFQGTTPSQAFFVKCDAETTTQDDINLGIVNVLVGFAPLKPAEFVVVKISQKAGQAS
jgi:phage tail sheath protein FI